MQTNPQLALPVIFTSYALRFQDFFAATPTWYQRLAMEIPSTARVNIYAFMDRLPRVREWIGERVLQNAQARSTEIFNKDYEDTIELERNDVDDMQIGLFGNAVDGLAGSMKKWPDALIIDQLRNGATSGQPYQGYDQQPYFSTAHPYKPGFGSQPNLFPSTPLTAANYNYVRSTMYTYIGADGYPLAVNPTLLVVPPQLDAPARSIVKSTNLATIIAGTGGGAGTNAVTAVDNVYAGTADVMVIPELAIDPTTWYLVDTSKPGLKPFIFQLRKAPQLLRKDNPNDDNVFWHKKYVFGADARGGAGPALWWLAAKCIG